VSCFMLEEMGVLFRTIPAKKRWVSCFEPQEEMGVLFHGWEEMGVLFHAYASCLRKWLSCFMLLFHALFHAFFMLERAV